MFELFTRPSIDNMTVFDHMKTIGEEGGVFGEFMKGATFMIGTRLVFWITGGANDESALTWCAATPKGICTNTCFPKIASAGENGQFRTPRHIIQMMVDMMQPKQRGQYLRPILRYGRFLGGEPENTFVKNTQSGCTTRNSEPTSGKRNVQRCRVRQYHDTYWRHRTLQLHGITNPNPDSKRCLE